MRLQKKTRSFEWVKFSRKQLTVLTWWMIDGLKQMDGIIADGSRRSGKTLVMAVSFIKWAFANYKDQDFIMAGKTIGSFKRNVYFHMKAALESEGYIFDYKQSDGYIVIRHPNGEQNYFYVFGGKDVSSAGVVQGMTAAGAFLDEAVLMPEEFVAMCMSSCSIEGSKYWFTCNPDNPNHYFKKEFIDRARDKNLIYLHFTMDDNFSLSSSVKERYKRQFTGVFFKRYILGLWVIAEGLIYDMIANNPDDYYMDFIDDDELLRIHIGVDFGESKSPTTFVATGYTFNYKDVIFLKSERRTRQEGGREVSIKDTPDTLADAFIRFVQSIEEQYPNTVKVIFADSAQQTLKRGLEVRLIEKDMRYNVYNALKKEIIERIQIMIELFSDKRVFFIRGQAESVKIAFTQAMWADNPLKDERLDDGSTDIDSLDAAEYCIERDIDKLQGYVIRR